MGTGWNIRFRVSVIPAPRQWLSTGEECVMAKALEIDVERTDAEAFGAIARRWFAMEPGTPEELAAAEILAGPPLSAKAARRNGPDGPPNTTWGFLSITRQSEGREKRSFRVFSDRNNRWFLEQLRSPFVRASIGFSILGDDGYSRISLVRKQVLSEIPGWARMTLSYDSQEETDSGNHAVLQRSLELAGGVAVAYGQFGGSFTLGRTALEDTLPGQPFPRDTLPRAREFLRGYDWLTICPVELVVKLGGIEHLENSGAFEQVRVLPDGAAWLLACEDYADFDEARSRRVWETLAPVLIPGVPVRREYHPGDEPHRIVFEGA